MSESGGQAPRERRARFSRAEAPPPEEENPIADPRRTERLQVGDEEPGTKVPVNPNWRRERTIPRAERRRPPAVPSSPQDIQIWLQHGGWRYIAAIAAFFIIALIGILAFNQSPRDTSRMSEPNPLLAEPTSQPGATIIEQPTVTTVPATPIPELPQFFVVSGTGAEGLFLRPEPSSANNPLTTLPEGTRVERIGEDTTTADRVWRHVREPGGLEGWVAIDFLQPAP